VSDYPKTIFDTQQNVLLPRGACLDCNIYEHREKAICPSWNILRHCSIEQQIVDDPAAIHNAQEFLMRSFEGIDFQQFFLCKLNGKGKWCQY